MKQFKKIVIIGSIVLFSFMVMPEVFPVIESNISVEAASVKLNKTKLTMNVKEKYTLKVKGTSQKVKWSTSNKKIATVNSKGKVTAKKKGKVTITAKVGNKKYKCKIIVESPKINKTNITLKQDNTFQLKIKNTTQKIKWSSSDKKIAKVDSKGIVRGISEGEAIITAKVGNSKYTCNITVPEPNYTAGINISYTKLTNKVLVLIKNNNKKAMDYIEVEANYYKNGVLLDTKNCHTVSLPAGQVAYNEVSIPLDEDYNYLEYDDVKFNVIDATIYKYVKSYEDAKRVLTINSNKSIANNIGIVGTIKNTGNNKVSTKITAVYYKNNQIVGTEYTYVDSIDAGATISFKIYKDYDNNYHDIDFDSYKINVDYAYFD